MVSLSPCWLRCELSIIHFFVSAGPTFNNNGVLMRCGANLLWGDGRRASFTIGYDRALTQYAQVPFQTPCLLSQ